MGKNSRERHKAKRKAAESAQRRRTAGASEIQQILSVTAQHNGATAGPLFDVPCARTRCGWADPVWLAGAVRVKIHEKYDRYLGPELLDLAYAARALDVAGAWACLADLGAQPPPAGARR